ncbi:MAG: DNA alkylation repair protein [Clostridiales Family XIII bacterium]|jgi:3-methyladenine DNA glycosylase AlkD|nr:DNA alkylation repair protein [Clostridiales Family XIII bacterium]
MGKAETMAQKLLNRIRDDLRAAADPAVAESNRRFFKEGEHFLCYGLKSAAVGKIAKRYVAETKEMPKREVLSLCEALWRSGYQEEAGVACALTEKLGGAGEAEDFDLYADWVNRYVRNWAMCDALCNHTIGELAMKRPELAERLIDWTRADNRWVRRGAAVTLIIPARRGLYLPLAFRIADALLQDADDMVQKGYGWMLKAAAEAHQQEVFDFVMERRAAMPRVALRYAIEKMPQDKRKLAMARE